MLNTIVRTVTFLVGHAPKVIAGLEQHGATLYLPHSMGCNLPGKLAALNASNAAHKQAIIEKRNKRLALLAAVQAARRFMMIVREHLKPRLGSKYSEQWSAVGFSGNLQVPSPADALLNPLVLAEEYLARYPVTDGGDAVSAQRAAEVHDVLATAIAAVAQQEEAVDRALAARRVDEKAVEAALRLVLGELHQVLDPLDSMWLAFGFKKPGVRSTPEAPEEPTAVVAGENAVAVKWPETPLADYYRVWAQEIGVDAEAKPVGKTSNLNFVIEEVSAGAQLEVSVSAVNDRGESRRSKGVVVALNR